MRLYILTLERDGLLSELSVFEDPRAALETFRLAARTAREVEDADARLWGWDPGRGTEPLCLRRARSGEDPPESAVRIVGREGAGGAS